MGQTTIKKLTDMQFIWKTGDRSRILGELTRLKKFMKLNENLRELKVSAVKGAFSSAHPCLTGFAKYT